MKRIKYLLSVFFILMSIFANSQEITDWPDPNIQRFYGPIDPYGGIVFDGERQILRVPYAGQNLNVDNLIDFFNWWYYTPPAITCNITAGSPFEIGTETLITISGTTTSYEDDLGVINVYENLVGLGIIYSTPEDRTSFTTSISFTPLKTPAGNYTEYSYRFYASQVYLGYDGSGTITSSTVIISAVFPIFYGISAVDYSVDPSGLYDSPLTKLVAAEGNKTIDLAGTGYIYFCFPTTWNDETLSSVLDGSSFENLGTFTKYLPTVEVQSSGLVNNWTQAYIVYKYNHQVYAVDYKNWQFIQ
jgi:hypothetical protein